MTSEVVSGVREHVLRNLDPQLVDERDVEHHVRERDTFIQMFCKHHADSHNGSYDVEAIGNRMIETLVWRKSFGVADLKPSDLPLEIWTQNETFTYEDDEYFVLVYVLRNDARFCDRWSEMRLRSAVCIHNNRTLEAVYAGKQVVALCDVLEIGMTGIDLRMHTALTGILDKHFPCMFQVTGVLGVPAFLVPIANFFMRFTMPPGLKKVMRMYTVPSFRSVLREEVLPERYGGRGRLVSLISTSRAGMRSLDKHASEFGLTTAEAGKILASLRKRDESGA